MELKMLRKIINNIEEIITVPLMAVACCFDLANWYPLASQ